MIDCSLPVDLHRELARRRLRLSQLELRPRHEALVVEPVQELAVVLREADDRRPAPGLELGQRGELGVLRLLEGGVDRPAVRTALGVAQLLLHPLDHVVA